MSILKSALGKLGKATGESFTPRPNIPRSDVQSAVEYVMDNAENVGTPYAPTDAEYLTNGAVSGLSNERAVQNGLGISWDWSQTGEATANLEHLGIEDLADPAADRGMFWDDSEGATGWFTPANGLGFVGTNLSITDANLHFLINEAFAQGDILYHDGSGLARLPRGTDGQFLRTRGALGLAPDWVNVPGGGDLLSANNLVDLDDAATARVNLGVEIGADVQAYDATLQSISALGTASDKIAYTTGIDTWAETALTAFARTLLDDANAAAMKVTLGLTIGTDVQAWSTHLDAIAALAKTDGNIIVANGTTFVAESGATARASLGVSIGSQVQAWSANLDSWSALAPSAKQNADATLTALAGVTTAADQLIYATGSDTFTTTSLTTFGRSLIDDADAATARTTLGLVIGTNVQAYDAELAALAGLTSAANKLPYFTGSGTASLADLTAFARTLLDDADAATARSTLGLVIGTNVQAYDAELAALAGLTSAADALPYFTGSGSAATTTMTSFGRSLIDDANAAAARTTLGLVIGTDVQAYSAILAGTTASFTTAQETKLGYITITQAVDLDAIEARIADLDAAVVLKGAWDASAGTFPGSGSAQAGWTYVVSVAGTVDGVDFSVDDRILAITDNASTSTYTGQWLKQDYTDKVLSVAGKIGTVTLDSNDITDLSSNGRSLITAANYAAMRGLLDLEIGTDVQAYDAELAAISGLTSAADRVPYFTGSGTAALATFTSFGRSLVDDADQATAQATLGLTIGTHVQAYDELLAEIAALSTDPNADSGLFFDDSAGNVAYWTPTSGVEFSGTNLRMTANQRTGCITYVIDGGGSAITTGIKGDFRVPAACTITGVTALADQTGSVAVDIWKDTLANFPPTDADTITAAAPVTISAATNSENTTLTGWTTALAAGDILRFNVDSVATIQRLTIELRVTKG